MSTYRPDIDGLRAVCIVSVVMFHAGFNDWAGGFVGVDIFFVISGFLITSLIGKQIAVGQFSLLAFYERRVRRLLAATIPVLLLTTLFALAFYTGKDIMTYCRSLIAFVVYGSNWFFLSQDGYFATPPETSPLLHTWSLGVEEQFYLAFPALLLALVRSPRAVPWVLGALAALSLGYAQWEIARGHLDTAFFGSFSRFWELLLGALLASVPALIDRTTRFALPMRAAGLAMVAASVLLYGSATPFPGVAALLPVCGALLLIAASPDSRDPLCRLLASSPMVYLGSISYSLYLWHWPVLGAARTLFADHTDAHVALAISVSVVLAALSYRFVEQPIRTRRKLGHGRHMAVMLASTSAIAIAFAAVGLAGHGWAARFPPQVAETVARAGKWHDVPEGCFGKLEATLKDHNSCRFGNVAKREIDLLLWGDSHSASLFAAVRRYAESHGLALAYAGRSGCVPLASTRRARSAAEAINQACLKFNDATGAFIRDNDIPVVLLAARWAFYASSGLVTTRQDDAHGARDGLESALERTLDALSGRRVVLVDQVPQHRSSNVLGSYIVLSRLGGSIETLAVSPAGHRKRQRPISEALERVAARDNNVLRIDPTEALCDRERCLIRADGKLLYFDGNHVNVDGSLLLYPLLERELDRFLASRGIAKDGAKDGRPLAAGTP
jgi:peptidoglycan/LPS O-acetylase OafA/YrhL